jgi:hypothetical protein
MKVYSISKGAFWAILLLILALPVSRHWRLLSAGERTRGTVLEYSSYIHEFRHGDREIRHASRIRFMAGDSLVVVFGPGDAEMEPGRRVGLCYDRDDPARYCLLTFAGFYGSQYTVLPVVLIIVWLAFYQSYNYYRKKSKKSPGFPRLRPDSREPEP